MPAYPTQRIHNHPRQQLGVGMGRNPNYHYPAIAGVSNHTNNRSTRFRQSLTEFGSQQSSQSPEANSRTRNGYYHH